ncbi:MAG: hypothetical protein WCW13_01370 [archaeon]
MDNLIIDLGETEPMDRLRVGELKKMDKYNQQEFVTRQKEINQSIKTVSNGKMLPERTLARYDERFSKKNEKRALLFVLCAFLVAFTFSFFMQPSIFFQYYSDTVYLANLSGREINNISIYPVTELAGLQKLEKTQAIVFIEKLAPKEVITIPSDYTGLFVALSDRQMPAIGFIPGSNESSGGLGDGVYQGLRDQAKE